MFHSLIPTPPLPFPRRAGRCFCEREAERDGSEHTLTITCAPRLRSTNQFLLSLGKATFNKSHNLIEIKKYKTDHAITASLVTVAQHASPPLCNSTMGTSDPCKHSAAPGGGGARSEVTMEGTAAGSCPWTHLRPSPLSPHTGPDGSTAAGLRCASELNVSRRGHR